LAVGHIESPLQLILDRQVGCDDEYSPPGDAERKDRGETGLPAADRELNECRATACYEELVRAEISLPLRLPEIRVGFDVGIDVDEVGFRAPRSPQPIVCLVWF